MRARPSPPSRLSLIALSLALLPMVGRAQDAQTAEKPEPPVFIQSDEASVQEGAYTEVSGNVVMNRGDMEMKSDWAKYNIVSDTVHSGDHVTVTQNGDVLTGKRLDMSVEAREGELEDPIYHMAQNAARGDAVKLLFDGKDKYTIQNGRMTTCQDGQDAWYLHAKEMNLDYNINYGQAWSGWVEFQGVPFFFYPWVDFPLDGSRKTGFLMPTFAYSSTNGFEYSQPFYWNIAPNYDATLTSTYFSKRGLMLGGEFRYLQPTYNGIIRAEGIHDRETQDDRYNLFFQHNQRLTDNLNLYLNYQKVSDNYYFSDFGDRLEVVSQVNLPQQAVLSYNEKWWSTYLNVQRYQTLQSITNPVTPPYSMEPQWHFTANPIFAKGINTTLNADITQFRSDTQEYGNRSWIYPTVSMPLTNSYGFITPKIGVHATYYNTQTPQGQDLGTDTRVLPIVSVDSGLYFDREDSFFGRGYTQSLEPRIYYLYVPYRNQSNLPNYDSGTTDLSWSQLFSENKFSGNDRINDANEITLAVSSRIFDDDSGVERFSVGIGQRFYLTSPRVTLSGPDSTSQTNTSDLLFTASANLPNNISASYTLQQSLQEHQTQKADFSVNWHPGDYKQLNLRYVLNHIATDPVNQIEQVDVSGQWPITRNWYAVGRYNYSLQDKKPVETLVGLEYNAGCWALRLAAQRYVTTDSTYKNNYFLLLELGGLAGIGTNPISTLRNSIPGYADTYSSPKLR